MASRLLGRLVNTLARARRAVSLPQARGHQDKALDDRYDMRPARPENAVDLFEGEWSGALPGLPPNGKPAFYTDPRVDFFERASGGFANKHVLELGPLEGSHTYMLQMKGAASITSIEANTRAYFKCLIVKNNYALHKARFLLGDFLKYLEEEPRRFDAIVASGVLYHMSDPVALIEAMCRSADAVCIWTHYYDHEIISRHPVYANRFDAPETIEHRGVPLTMSRQTYVQQVLDWKGFCGGAERVTRWVEKDSLLRLFDVLGFDVEIGKDDPAHVNGPALTFVARKRKSG